MEEATRRRSNTKRQTLINPSAEERWGSLCAAREVLCSATTRGASLRLSREEEVECLEEKKPSSKKEKSDSSKNSSSPFIISSPKQKRSGKKKKKTRFPFSFAHHVVHSILDAPGESESGERITLCALSRKEKRRRGTRELE